MEQNRYNVPFKTTMKHSLSVSSYNEGKVNLQSIIFNQKSSIAKSFQASVKEKTSNLQPMPSNKKDPNDYKFFRVFY
jgi:hypothetical protein